MVVCLNAFCNCIGKESEETISPYEQTMSGLIFFVVVGDKLNYD